MARRLAVIPGDGVGQEVIPPAAAMLKALLPDLEVVEAEAGWATFQATGTALPEATLEAIAECGAALFGAVASPSQRVAGYSSPILELRRRLDLYANLRPTRSWPLAGCPPEVDLLLVRENTEGLYTRHERTTPEGALAERPITKSASQRVGALACRLAAQAGHNRLTVVHKANVLPLTDGLFRDSVRSAGADHPGLQVEELLVDTTGYWLARDTARFRTLVTPNLYGDILSDVAAGRCGGLGLAPSLNLGERAAIAEPVHGAAPDIAGQGIANPLGAILSGALLCRHHWGLPAAADAIEAAVEAALAEGLRTPDIAAPGEATVTTEAMAEAVLARLTAP